MKEKIEQALNKIRPALQATGRRELAVPSPTGAKVRRGACGARCPR
jgi:hypothetical protein